MNALQCTNLAELIQAGLRRDTWEPEYGSTVAWDNQRVSEDKIEVNLERAPLIWEPLGTAYSETVSNTQDFKRACNQIGDLFFLDGVMRMHTRLLLEQDDQYSYSGLGSAAVGALRISPGTPISMDDALLSIQVHRCILLNKSYQLTEPTTIPGIPHAFLPRYYAQKQNAPSEGGESASRLPESTLQKAMRQAEKKLLESLLEQRLKGIFIVDGPLPQYSTVHSQKEQPVVGFIKTLHTRYLPPEQHQVLYQLKAGQRSPLFRIGHKQISWYLCLANPEPMDTPLSGLVRLEMVTDNIQADIARVQQFADRLSRILPGLTLARYEDPRSPQNLLPIHTLEKQLKMRMGDRRLIQRYINDYFRQQEFL